LRNTALDRSAIETGTAYLTTDKSMTFQNRCHSYEYKHKLLMRSQCKE